ncbi:GGDEF domain-containing protein [Sphingomicrobium lutaoense]|uniref:diguanylate cyclase n=1 Tax=Sphingomicrobium lutaoense TaxID=515949 RepID=A0A839YVJ7_9SPHN|nr:GGDEF domain-containing protein [Sphingomicrobium lutaoense]MBB3763229.1 diguanylate cyclase (GGDEF)-like protein [Sphingomicrobium lutaoense]
MEQVAAFFFLVPMMFVLFGAALAAVAMADRELVAARWGAAAFFVAALGVTGDALRSPDDTLLRYIILVSHFLVLVLMLKAFVERHGAGLPRLSIAVALGGAVIYAPFSPLDQWPELRVVMVQVIASGILLPFLAQSVQWARSSTIDRMIYFAVAFSFLSYLVRAGLYAGEPSAADEYTPLFQNIYDIIFHITTAVIGFSVGIVLLVAVGVDALMREARESETDALTGIGNRRALTSAIEADERGEWRCGAVIALDLDRFKEVNDRFGHAAGDTLLIEVAQTLDSVLGRFGRLCRIGGEEFILLVDEAHADATEALSTTAGKAIASISLGGPLEGTATTACVGFQRRDEGNSIAETMNAADRAVYRGKSDGRNKVVAAVGNAATLELKAVQ